MNTIASNLPLSKFIFAGTLFGGLFSSAWVMASPGTWMPQARPIQSIILEGDSGGKAVVIIEGGVPAAWIPPACNSPYNTIDLSTSKGRGQLALVLSAYNSGKPIRLALSCIGDRPLISHIALGDF